MKKEFESWFVNEFETFVTRQERTKQLENVKKMRLLADELAKIAWSSDYSDLQEVHNLNFCANVLVQQIEMTPEEHEEQQKRNEEWDAMIELAKKKAALRGE